MNDLIWIFGSALTVNNLVLAYGLGLCPGFRSAARMGTALRLGATTAAAMVVAVLAVWVLNALVWVHAPYLRLISLVVVIAILVQLVEVMMRRLSPSLSRAMGEFVPLAASNCAVLGLALMAGEREYSLVQGLVFALGAGAGYILALMLLAGFREEAELAQTSAMIRGAGLSLIFIGILSLVFLGLAGLFD